MTAENRIECLIRAAERLTGGRVCIYCQHEPARSLVSVHRRIHYHPWCRIAIDLERDRCILCDTKHATDEAMRLAAAPYELQQPFIKYCHAGVCEAVVPVRDASGKTQAVVFVGQCRVIPGELSREKLRELVSLGYSETEVISAWDKLNVTDETILSDTALLLAYSIEQVITSYTPETKPDDYVSAAREYICRNLLESDNLVRSTAGHIGVSVEYLGRIFKRSTGMTVSKYITNLRIERACILLANTGDSIESIAYASGYSDPSYFSRAFRRNTGMTPGDYRRMPRV